MKRFPRWLKGLTIVLIVLAIVSVVGIAFASIKISQSIQWDEGMIQGQETTFLYDKDNNSYQSLHGTENRVYVTLDEISPYLQDCFVASEDARFYEHNGVDVIRVIGALVRNFRSGGFSQGASTITMQLARNAVLDDQTKTWTRKIKETFIAMQLERQYTKQEILEMYLNEVYLGHGCYGVETASLKYYDKHANELTLSEAATLVGIAPNPGKYSPIVNLELATKNRNDILDDLVTYKPSYKTEAEAAKQEQIVVTGKLNELNPYVYPWFTDYVIAQAEQILEEQGLSQSQVYTGGLRIYTTLDPTTQETLEELYADSSNFPSSNTGEQVESAAVIIDHTSGQIRGLVGGREYSAQRGLSRATDMQRQPGSTFKPIAVYGPALEAGYSPDSRVIDEQTTFGDTYSPKNYDGKYRGNITMRTAIQYSINVPAVKFLQALGIDYVIPFIEKNGIDMSQNMDTGLALALGGLTVGVSPLQMAAAYGTFANMGTYIEPTVITKITDSEGKVIYEANQDTERVYSEQTAAEMTDMLETVTESGTGTNAQMNRPVASKTGTTQLPDKAVFANISTGNKDAWFAAYTPELVGVVWMGYDHDQDSSGNPQYLHQIYGGKYPALIWKNVMTAALDGVAVKDFPTPSSTVDKPQKNLDGRGSGSSDSDSSRRYSSSNDDDSNDNGNSAAGESSGTTDEHGGTIIEDPSQLPEGEQPSDLMDTTTE